MNAIIRDIERGGYEGIGKPEPLKDNLSGYWSRRIDDYNRIVYKIDGEVVEIVQCGTHYHCVKKLKMCIHTLQFGIGYFPKRKERIFGRKSERSTTQISALPS